MKLLVATGNPGKLGEVREILGPALLEGAQHELVSLAALKLPEPDETGQTFEENAAIKARAGALGSGLWTLADDSGICVDALGGAPGIRSARYADSEEARREKLLRALAAVPEGRRSAHFFCAVALSSPDGARLFRADGQVPGRIVEAARGTGGFGYDPLFAPDEIPSQTLAEIAPAEKNRLSHRGRALARLLPLLQRLLHDGDLA